MFPPQQYEAHPSKRGLLNRRQFLRSGSAVLALPFLEALAPRLVRGQP